MSDRFTFLPFQSGLVSRKPLKVLSRAFGAWTLLMLMSRRTPGWSVERLLKGGKTLKHAFVLSGQAIAAIVSFNTTNALAITRPVQQTKISISGDGCQVNVRIH